MAPHRVQPLCAAMPTAYALTVALLAMHCSQAVHADHQFRAASVPVAAAGVVARTLLATRSVQQAQAWPEYKWEFPNGRRFWDKYFGHTAQIALGQDPEALDGVLCVRVCCAANKSRGKLRQCIQIDV